MSTATITITPEQAAAELVRRSLDKENPAYVAMRATVGGAFQLSSSSLRELAGDLAPAKSVSKKSTTARAADRKVKAESSEPKRRGRPADPVKVAARAVADKVIGVGTLDENGKLITGKQTYVENGVEVVSWKATKEWMVAYEAALHDMTNP